MTELEKVLSRENKVLVDCLKVVVNIMGAQESIQAERKRLADLAIKAFRDEVSNGETVKDPIKEILNQWDDPVISIRCRERLEKALL